MRSLFALFLVFQALACFSQSSCETHSGSDLHLEEAELQNPGNTITSSQRSSLLFSLGYNLNKKSLFTPKVGLSLVFNNYDVIYNTTTNIKYLDYKTEQNASLQFHFGGKLQLFESPVISIRPQLGFNLNLLSLTRITESQPNTYYFSKRTQLTRNIFFQSCLGLQFEKPLQDNLSILFDIDYLLLWRHQKYHLDFYESKQDIRFKLGVKKGISPVKNIFHSGLYLGIQSNRSLYSFVEEYDIHTLPSYYDFTGTQSEISSRGLGLSLHKRYNQWFCFQEFSVSKINLAFKGGKTYHFLYKTGNPFLIEEFDTYTFDYESKKYQAEYAFNVGYCFFNQLRFHILPSAGLFYQFSSSSKLLKNEYVHHVRSIYASNYPNSEGKYVDYKTYGKATEYITDTSHSSIGLKFSLGFSYELMPDVHCFSRISRYAGVSSQFHYNKIYDKMIYRLEFGVFLAIAKKGPKPLLN